MLYNELSYIDLSCTYNYKTKNITRSVLTDNFYICKYASKNLLSVTYNLKWFTVV